LAALAELTEQTAEPFGVVVAEELGADIMAALPPQAKQAVVPAGWSGGPAATALIETVYSLAEADEAIGRGAWALALKGSEGAGRVGTESSFLMFLGLRERCAAAGVGLYVYGGVGVHTAAAYLALGARGVFLDSQVCLLPECGAPKALKSRLAAMSGTETQLVDGFRVLHWPAGPRLADGAVRADLLPHLGGLDLERDLLPLGQDFALAAGFARRYVRLRDLVFAISEAAYGHLRQAQAQPPLRAGSELAARLGVSYPIVQGPMARVSDSPAFLAAVAEAGALPCLSLGLAGADETGRLLAAAAAAVSDRPWAVGLLGFAEPARFNEQTQRILELERPPAAVVIAGGRPAQARRFEAAGLTAFLHVPSPALLDLHLKEGSRSFIFEGRESGGHVGPTPSAVLWELQLQRLLDWDDPAALTVLFAGGLFDTQSAAFVSVMAASLAARGAQIGVVLGTAYLVTEEAVATGAITRQFQSLACAARETVLLESAKGQETRALPTPFTDYFRSERQRVFSLDLDDLAKRAALEELNLGRARVAAKGVDRVDRKVELTHASAQQAWGAGGVQAGGAAELAALPDDEQLRRGLYMCGESVALLNEPTTMASLHAQVDAAGEFMAALESPVSLEESPRRRAWTVQSHVPAQTPIAIVGLAGVFPQADNVDDYWRNIVLGVDSVVEVPSWRWDPEIFFNPDTADTDFVSSKWGAFLSAAEFDPVEFGIAPQSVSSIEPAQLLSLLVAKRALQDAGYADFRSFDHADTSVIFGAEAMGELTSQYGFRPGIRSLFGGLPKEVADTLPRVTEDSFPGILSNVTAGRIANRLDLGGRNFTVDAACASSLASLDIACQELWSDRANLVLCGGADLHNAIFDYVMFSATHALSRSGHCATFDESGSGMTLGEGVGAVVLKRLSEAESDGDKIYAVIRGVHGSSDGRSLGLTAPDARGQVAALRRAYRLAGVLPAEVGLIEAHGTGTAVGDRTELGALISVLTDGGALPGQVYAGSVKTQIGHTKCAAGVAGLIRAALATYHAVIPPTLHLDKPVRNYVPGRSPLAFNASGHAIPWNSDHRVAGVSGFGFGGTNFHAIIQNHVPAPAGEPVLKSWPAELFVFRGDAAAASAQAEQVKALWEGNHQLRLADVAYSLAQASDQPVQLAVVASSWPDLLAKLDAAAAGQKAPGVFPREEVAGKVAFLFSGQGSQRLHMARDLFVAFPELRQQLSQHPDYHRLVFPPSVFTEEARKAQRQAVTDTRVAQPLLGFADLAIAELLGRFGLRPDCVAGHSYGELPALAYAGVIGPDDLPGLSRSRAEAILGAVGDDPGKMIPVNRDAEATAELLDGEEDLWAVNLNSPRQTVVGGTSAAVDRLAAKLAEQGLRARPLDVACAFHTPLLAGADAVFAKALRRCRFGKPRLPVWSNTTAAPYPTAASAIKARLAEHLVSPVRFAEQLQAMYDDGVRVFVEAGPGAVLAGLARQNLGSDIVAIQTEKDSGDGLTTLLEALGRYLATGRLLDLGPLFEGRPLRLLDLADPAAAVQSRTAWMVDGLEAVPAAQWRAQGDQHVARTRYAVEDLRRFALDEAGSPAAGPAGTSPEELVQSYLQNVRALLDDQRDVMLGYLGCEPGVGRRAPASPAEPAASRELEPSPADGVAAGPLAAGEEEDENGDASVLLELKDLSPDDVHNLIIEVVSDKTGYPTDMLGLDMDLEADLSIDSIKRLEIIGSLNQKVALPNVDEMDMDEDQTASALEHMASIKTLRGMISWLQEMVEKAQTEGTAELLSKSSGDGAAQPVRPALAAGPSAAPPSPVEVVRLIPVRQPYPLGTERLDLAGKCFALAGDGSDADAAITAALADAGATTTPAQAGPQAADWDGLVFVNRQGAPAVHDIKDLFGLLKAADLKKLGWLLVLDDTTGWLREAADLSGLDRLEGFAGLVKTLQIEYPALRARLVDTRQPFAAADLPDLVLAELADPVRFPAVAYDNGQRVRLIPALRPLPDSPAQATADGGLAASLASQLEADSVVLVLGGAQGISPALVKRLAASQPCHWVLVGRTPRDVDLAQAYADTPAADIKKRLLAEGLASPKEIEARVRAIAKARQVEQALAEIADSGADVAYESADVRDPAALRALLARVKSRHGRLDAVFHAAGVLEDKLFKDKTWASFERVYTTKTTPLRVLAEDLDGLKLLVLFSSVAASFGNRGQADYAAANSVFDAAAFVLGQRQEQLKAVAVAWGPWQGAGMVGAALEAEMRKRGLSLIDLDEGGDYFRRELSEGHEANVLALAGRPDEITAYIGQALA
jgi:acyl transferase domain-containing protein/NAD(P)H-dependent flavin oxidoreductase YrpB (nitropropane dioxygenase family)/NAD(P)-dependent dehydrogenase (short-subunit alcohol dehydrogenase family)